jgi:hypothetical protein
MTVQVYVAVSAIIAMSYCYRWFTRRTSLQHIPLPGRYYSWEPDFIVRMRFTLNGFSIIMNGYRKVRIHIIIVNEWRDLRDISSKTTRLEFSATMLISKLYRRII